MVKKRTLLNNYTVSEKLYATINISRLQYGYKSEHCNVTCCIDTDKAF